MMFYVVLCIKPNKSIYSFSELLKCYLTEYIFFQVNLEPEGSVYIHVSLTAPLLMVSCFW